MSSDHEREGRMVEFLRGLRKLTLSTGIEIAGCGCCGSPWLSSIDSGMKDGGYEHEDWEKISWIDTSYYDWEDKKGDIIK